eukprot:TRINITY_DN27117_c0_g1_i1.p2 TRINITY_DN27117_c0_g1~~TRINITY_DN27117_c0_g1_i1.p2  ORF type:complete len:418 (+),score=68.15 TRINITY_DN27117_c0_g1_i1:113-1255(+)
MATEEVAPPSAGIQPVVVLPAEAAAVAAKRKQRRARAAARREEAHRREFRRIRHNTVNPLPRQVPPRPPAPPRVPPISLSTLSTRPSAPCARIIPPRGEAMNRQGGPGPGEYNSEQVVPYGCKAAPRIMRPVREQRDRPFLRPTGCAPGPGAYSPEPTVVGALGAQSGVGPPRGAAIVGRPSEMTAAEAARGRRSPGPGSYAAENALGPRGRVGAAAYSFGGRPALRAEFKETRFLSPGPGAYMPQPPTRGTAVAMHWRFRPLCDSEGPGPGAYKDHGGMGSMGGVCGKHRGPTLKWRTMWRMPQLGQGPPSTNYDTRPALASPRRRPGGSARSRASRSPPRKAPSDSGSPDSQAPAAASAAAAALAGASGDAASGGGSA